MTFGSSYRRQTFWMRWEDDDAAYGTVVHQRVARLGVLGVYPQGRHRTSTPPRLLVLTTSEPTVYKAGGAVTFHSHLTAARAGKNFTDRPALALTRSC